MGNRPQRRANDPDKRPSDRLTPALWIVHKSGVHWTLLAALLLITNSAAMWAVRHSPIAISGIWLAEAGMISAIPAIMAQRARMLEIALTNGKPLTKPGNETAPET